jgi:hypothetical protein
MNEKQQEENEDDNILESSVKFGKERRRSEHNQRKRLKIS